MGHNKDMATQNNNLPETLFEMHELAGFFTPSGSLLIHAPTDGHVTCLNLDTDHSLRIYWDDEDSCMPAGWAWERNEDGHRSGGPLDSVDELRSLLVGLAM